jgi:hypothetical protein
MHFDFLEVRFWSCNFVFHYQLISVFLFFCFLFLLFIRFRILGGMRRLNSISLAILFVLTTLHEAWSHGDQPLSKIAVHKASLALQDHAYVKTSPTILGLKVSFNSAMLLFFISILIFSLCILNDNLFN